MANDNLRPLKSLDELYSTKQLAAKLDLKPGYILKLRWEEPNLPYLRFGGHVFFIEDQVVDFMNDWQGRPDPYYIDRMRRLRSGIPVGRGRMPSNLPHEKTKQRKKKEPSD